jgi:hypothetical protein
MLSWYLATKDPEKTPLPFWVTALIAFGLMLFLVHILPMIQMRLPPSTKKMKITEKGIFRKSGNSSKIWRYEDIQSFQIREEHLEDGVINVLELKNFNGLVLAAGLTPEIPIDQLSVVLSDRIGAARQKVKDSFIVRGRYWQNLVGILLIGAGLMAFLALFSISIDDEIAEKRAKKFEAKVEERIAELRSEGISEEQLAAFEKVIRWSMLKGLALSRWIKNLVLISIGSGLFLLGCVMTLWGRNRLLNDKIAKLEVYWADMFENEGTKQEGETI